MLKVDLHLHTGEDPVDRIAHSAVDLVGRAAELGFDALAVTLHQHQLADPRVDGYARERGITLIPGVERTIQGRHVLLLDFPAAAAESVRTLGELEQLKARTGGLVIAPHPYFPAPNCLHGHLDARPDLFDAVEWSYFWTRGINFNARAARWARAHGKPVVGNSDTHHLRQLGRTYSLIDAPPEPAAICDAIRQGRVTLQTTPVPVAELVDVFARVTVLQRRQSKRPSSVSTPGVVGVS